MDELSYEMKEGDNLKKLIGFTSITVSLLILASSFSGCNNSATKGIENKNPQNIKTTDTNTVGLSNESANKVVAKDENNQNDKFISKGITWDTSFGTIIAAGDSTKNASYPRLTIDTNKLILVYDSSSDKSPREINFKFSKDEGKTWSEEVIVDDGASDGGAYTPCIVKLRDGTLLCSYRLGEPTGSKFILRVKKSVDGGKTWQFHSDVIAIDKATNVGVWEPYLVEHPTINNKIYCFYADEVASFGSQSISYKIYENWEWGVEYEVPRPPESTRDGMPIICLENNQFVLVFESNAILGKINSVICRKSTSLEGEIAWGPRKTVYTPSKTGFRAGAPYIVRAGNGDLICSFQTDEDTPLSQDIMDGKYIIAPGGDIDNWIAKDYQFECDSTHFAKSNTLLMLDDNNILAGCRSNMNTGYVTIQLKKGKLK